MAVGAGLTDGGVTLIGVRVTLICGFSVSDGVCERGEGFDPVTTGACSTDCGGGGGGGGGAGGTTGAVGATLLGDSAGLVGAGGALVTDVVDCSGAVAEPRRATATTDTTTAMTAAATTAILLRYHGRGIGPTANVPAIGAPTGPKPGGSKRSSHPGPSHSPV